MNTFRNRIHAYLQRKLFAIAFLEGLSIHIGTEGVHEGAMGTCVLNLDSKRAQSVHVLPMGEMYQKHFYFEVVLAHEIGHCVAFNEKGFSSEWSANQWAKKFIRSLPIYMQILLWNTKNYILN
jgi:hypothetical protein